MRISDEELRERKMSLVQVPLAVSIPAVSDLSKTKYLRLIFSVQATYNDRRKDVNKGRRRCIEKLEWVTAPSIQHGTSINRIASWNHTTFRI